MLKYILYMCKQFSMKLSKWFFGMAFCTLAYFQATAQTPSELSQRIEKVVSDKKVKIGVSIWDEKGKELASVHGNEPFPMQSVFKFHIALVVLSQVDQGKLSLTQPIRIDKKELLPDLYSPLKDAYPNGATLPLSKILEYTVSQSDNVGCDVLLRLIGGPKAVENYFTKNGFKNISIKINEEIMQANWDLQFQNWTTPQAANAVLKQFYENKPKRLSAQSHQFIWEIMKNTQTGQARLKGDLPAHTTVAHKTGFSGSNPAGITAAVNDVGVVFMPNGHHFYISVFVTESSENTKTNEKIIAEVARLAWDWIGG
jgi:beta-lactamase class A